MDGWTTVHARTPEPKTKVLCCGPCGGLFIGFYRGGYTVDENEVRSAYAFDSEMQSTRFVAWMPLPEPYSDGM